MDQINENEIKSNDNTEIKRPIFYKKELIIIGLFILVLSVIACLITISLKFNEDIIKIGEFSILKDQLLPSALLGLGVNILLFIFCWFIKLTPDENVLLKEKKANKIIPLIILFILGILAFTVIDTVIYSLGLNNFIATTFIASFIELIYFYLMIKLYVFNYIEEKNIFYEIIRFALVGIIASLFDFATCFVFQFYILKSLNDVAITILSVTAGFIVGVIINYLCSVYMVYKSSTSNKSKTLYGKILFLVLALVGLGLGYLLQYCFYDVLHLGYVLTFIIRTLIVLVWNYLSRKFFIFK